MVQQSPNPAGQQCWDGRVWPFKGCQDKKPWSYKLSNYSSNFRLHSFFLYPCCHLEGNQQVFAHSQIVVVFVVCHFTQWSGIHCQIKKGMVFCFQNCSGILQEKNCSQDKLLKFKTEGRIIEKCLRSLAQFFRSVKSEQFFEENVFYIVPRSFSNVIY